MRRAGLIIDADNLGIATGKKFNGSSLNYRKLFRIVSENHNLIHASCYLHRTEGNEGFVTMLEKTGYLVSQRDRRTNVDTFLIWHAFHVIPKLDVLFLGVGDGDYLPILWECRYQGAGSHLISVEGALASSLKDSADEVTYISEELVYRKEETPMNSKRIGL